MKRLFLLSLLALLPVHAFAQSAALPIHPNATISIAVTGSASSATAVPIGSQPSWQLELQNTGSALAFCAFGGSTVTATTSGYPIMAGVDKTVTVDQDRKFISCITSTGTTTIYVTGGVGN